MSRIISGCLLVASAIHLITAIDESLFIQWPDFMENIEGKTYMGVGLLDRRAEHSNIGDHLKSRWIIEVLPSGQIKGTWSTWLRQANKCFYKVLHVTNASNLFVSLENTVVGPTGVSIDLSRRFISSHPDKYVFLLICGDRDEAGVCVDGITELSIKESLYDKDQDGQIDDDAVLPMSDIKADAQLAFGVDREDFQFIWSVEIPYCPLQPKQ